LFKLMSVKSLKICIVSHNAYGAITGNKNGHIGGVEWQTTLLAKWLVMRGHKVSFITWNEAGLPEQQLEGIRIITLCRKNAGLPGLRFFHPKWTSLVAALRRADAEVYYQNCGECVTGQVAMWCRSHRRPFVFSSANDTDCDAKLPELGSFRERLLYRYGIRHADRVIVQTEKQRLSLRSGFGLDSVCIPMPCPGPLDAELTSRSFPVSRRVLWIARIHPQKRPDRFLDVAESCPELEFDFVGPPSGDTYSQQITQRAKAISNIIVHGAVPRERVSAYFQRAALFCCTSDYEGFPNTFLEAWSHGVPIVTTFDPDALIQKRGLGMVASDTPGLIAGVRKMFDTPGLYQKAAGNARQYYLENHTVEAVMPQFEKVFQDAAMRKPVERS
jgi:glycosyltransferase involved in cell wall biosynthesis